MPLPLSLLMLVISPIIRKIESQESKKYYQKKLKSDTLKINEQFSNYCAQNNKLCKNTNVKIYNENKMGTRNINTKETINKTRTKQI